jgi:hypothetical protein
MVTNPLRRGKREISFVPGAPHWQMLPRVAANVIAAGGPHIDTAFTAH